MQNNVIPFSGSEIHQFELFWVSLLQPNKYFVKCKYFGRFQEFVQENVHFILTNEMNNIIFPGVKESRQSQNLKEVIDIEIPPLFGKQENVKVIKR
jgi:hypothetical protein